MQISNAEETDLPRPINLGYDREEPPVVSTDKSERRGLAIAIGGHVLLFGLLSANFSSPPPPPIPGAPMQVTIFDPGIPAFGDPTGDNAPPRPQTEQEAAIDTQPVPSPETPEETQPETQTSAESETSIDKTPEPQPKPAPEKPMETPEEATAKKASNLPQRVPTTPSQDVGTGALAVGATTHGDAKGLDANLSAAVGRAVASQMRACWDPPRSGVRLDTASILIVRYAKDGTLADEPTVTRIVDQQSYPVPVEELNGYETSAVDALKRCSPIRLAPVLYPYWKEVEVQLFGAKMG